MVRVIVVSEQPALALALGAQLPDCDARSAASIDAVIDLTSDEAAVVLDVGSEEARERWIEDLRQQGLHRRTVVIDGVPGGGSGGSGGRDAQDEAADDGVLRLHRPFSFAALATALAQAAGAGGPLGEEEGEPQPAGGVGVLSPRGPSEGLVADTGEEQPLLDDQAEPEPEPRVAPATQPQPSEPRIDPPAAAERTGHAGGSHGEDEASEVDAAPQAAAVLPVSDGGSLAGEVDEPASARSARPPMFERLFRTRRGVPSSGGVAATVASDAVQEQVLRAARAVEALEDALQQVPALADANSCASAVVAEISDAFPDGAVRVLLRADGHLDVVATSGLDRELARGALALDHSFLGAVRRGGGALLLVPTDEARGLLAGVPLSSWPALFAVEVGREGRTEALVLMGGPETARPEQLRQLVAMVEDAGVLLRFAAALRRLYAGNHRSTPEFLRSWMIGADDLPRYP